MEDNSTTTQQPPKRILVVDDKPNNLSLVTSLLRPYYEVLLANNGERALRIASEKLPDLILLDIMMPGMDGYGVLHAIHKNEEIKNTPFIFLTAKTERSDMRKGMEMGADDFITKPFEEIELLNDVETRLKKAEILQNQYQPDQKGLSEFLSDIRNTGLVEKLSEKYEVESYPKKQMLYLHSVSLEHPPF